MEVFINGTVEEIVSLFSCNFKQQPMRHQEGVESSTPSNPSSGRPSLMDRTLKYIGEHPQKEYDLTKIADATTIPSSTLRNHMLKLNYNYNIHTKRWSKNE